MLCAQCLWCMTSLSDSITLPHEVHRSWPGGRGEREGPSVSSVGNEEEVGVALGWWEESRKV